LFQFHTHIPTVHYPLGIGIGIGIGIRLGIGIVGIGIGIGIAIGLDILGLGMLALLSISAIPPLLQLSSQVFVDLQKKMPTEGGRGGIYLLASLINQLICHLLFIFGPSHLA